MLLFISGPLQPDSICPCDGIVPFSLHLFRQRCELLRLSVDIPVRDLYLRTLRQSNGHQSGHDLKREQCDASLTNDGKSSYR